MLELNILSLISYQSYHHTAFYLHVLMQLNKKMNSQYFYTLHITVTRERILLQMPKLMQVILYLKNLNNIKLHQNNCKTDQSMVLPTNEKKVLRERSMSARQSQGSVQKYLPIVQIYHLESIWERWSSHAELLIVSLFIHDDKAAHTTKEARLKHQVSLRLRDINLPSSESLTAIYLQRLLQFQYFCYKMVLNQVGSLYLL